MRKRYLVLALLATILLLNACSALSPAAPTATTVPFNLYTGQDVIDAFSQAGLPITSMVRDTIVGRDAPLTFNDRYVFTIDRIAPNGGQILVFQSAESMQAWTEYIDQLRADSNTRRDVVYVFTNGNIMVQVNAGLTPQEANEYRDALATLIP
jgi:hypothetical protein